MTRIFVAPHQTLGQECKVSFSGRCLAIGIAAMSSLWAQAPLISAGGVVGAGLSQPPVITPSPLSIVSIFGQNFAPSGTARLVGTSDLLNNLLPTNLANTCVTFNGVAAPLFAVFPNQINAQVPVLGTTSAQVQVTSACGTSHSTQSNVVTVGLAVASPEFFYFSGNASVSIAAANQNGAYLGMPGLIPGVNFVAANPGDIAVLFATGLGPTQSPLKAGELNPGGNLLASPASISIGGVMVKPADILYSGAAPGFAGLYQINLKIGAYLPTGDQPVLLTVAGITAPLGSLPIAAVVTPTCALPNIDVLAAVQDQLTAAGMVTVNYTTEGATSVSMTPIGGANLMPQGSVASSLSTTSTVTLSAQNSCGTATQSIQIAVGTPGLAAVVNAMNPGVGASAQPGQLLALTPLNLAHPEMVTQVVFASASGPTVYEDVVGLDASGNFLVHAPLIADPSVPQGYDTGAFTVAYVWNGQSTPSLNLTITALSYQGNALADFSSLLDQYYNAAVQTNTLYGNDPTFGSAAPGMLQIINTLYDSIQQWVNALHTSSSVAVPLDPIAGPSAGTTTVGVDDIATVMAYNTNLLVAGRSAGGFTASIRGPQPRDLFGCSYNSLRTTNKALAYCLIVKKVSDGLAPAWSKVENYVKWIPFGTLGAAAFTTALTAAATVAGSVLGLAEASEAFCDLSPVYITGQRPFSISPVTIPLSSTTPANVFVTLGSKNQNAEQVTAYLAEEATEALIKFLVGEIGKTIDVNLVKEYFVKSFSNSIAKQLNNLNLQYPPVAGAEIVGNCDITFTPVPPIHLSLYPATPPDYSLHGDLWGKQTINIVPFQGHFLYLQPPYRFAPPYNYTYPISVFVKGAKSLAVSGQETQVCASFTPTGPNPLIAGGCSPPDGDAFVDDNTPYFAADVLGPVFGSVAVRQTDESTWQITASANNVYEGYAPDDSYFYEGNGYVGFTASLGNPANADGSQAMYISASQSQPDCVSNLVVSGISGAGTPNTNILAAGGPLTGSLSIPGATGAVLNFGLGTFDVSTLPSDPYYNQPCQLTVTVQMTGDDTGTAAVKPIGPFR